MESEKGQAGNEGQDINRQYVYDAANHIIQVTDGKNVLAEYGYDGLDRRVSSKEAGGDKTTRYLYADDINVLMEIDGQDQAAKDNGKNDIIKDKSKVQGKDASHVFPQADQVRENIYGANGMVARYNINPAGKISNDSLFYQYDGLGSVAGLTNKEGDLIERYNYDAFGNLLQSKKLEHNSPYTFTSKPYDQKTGLYYYGARYYDPTVGRFTSKDPVAGLMSMPGTLNPYVYVLNNPVKYTDPSGQFIPVLLAVVEGAMLAWTIYDSYTVLNNPCLSTGEKTAMVGVNLLTMVGGPEAKVGEKLVRRTVEEGAGRVLVGASNAVAKDIKVVGRLQDTAVARDWAG